jgi:RNA polymerase sigma factor (sigma-70 family)
LSDITLNIDGSDAFFSPGTIKGEERLRSVIEQCKNDVRSAQFELYKLSFDFLYRVAIRYEKNHDDAIEVINEAFYKILMNIQSYKAESSFYPWMKTILLNCIFNKFKKSNTLKKGREHQVVSFEDEYMDVSIAPGILDKIDSEYVLYILQYLPELTRKIFNLFVMEDYTHKHISELLGISVSASKWHVYEGKRKLTEHLKLMHEKYETGK